MTTAMLEAVHAREEQASVGAITEVHGPVVVIACDRLPPLRQALYASINHERYLFEVHQHLDKRHVRAITLHSTAGLRRDTPVYDTGAPLHVPVTADCLGRLLNIFGEPLDSGAPLWKRGSR
jgi:F-type H+-transporting ATPase subunit beta